MKPSNIIYTLLTVAFLVLVLGECAGGHWSKTERATVISKSYSPPYITTSYDGDGHVIIQNYPEQFTVCVLADTFGGEAGVTASYYNSIEIGAPVYARVLIGRWTKAKWLTQIVPNPEQ